MMEYRELGQTGIRVSRLCFGALTVGPLQANLSVQEGGAVIARALDAGVNFIDTAEYYHTYEHIKEGIQGRAQEVVIASKSYAYTKDGMQESLEKALRELGRDYIDIFLLHEQESALTIKGHWEAVEFLLGEKKKGTVRALGISTHSVEGVVAAALVPEFDIIHPLINIAGVGIMKGNREDMERAIGEAHLMGKGMYGMKSLGGGNLLARVQEAFSYVLSLPGLSAVAVGMRTLAEVDYNVKIFEGLLPSPEVIQQVASEPRRLHIESWCEGCGQCLARCGAKALQLVDGKATVDESLCRLCGYCGAVCPEFCIKIV